MRKKKFIALSMDGIVHTTKKVNVVLRIRLKNATILAIFGMQTMTIFVKMRKGRLLKTNEILL